MADDRMEFQFEISLTRSTHHNCHQMSESNQDRMDISKLPDETFRFMVGMSTHSSSAIPNAGMKVSLRVLTSKDVRPEFDVTPSSARQQHRIDTSIFLRFGIPPHRLFEGDTKIVRMKNRGIAWLGVKLGGVDSSKMYSTNQESDEQCVDCLRCGTIVTFEPIGKIHAMLNRHEHHCTGRNYCDKCFTI